VLAFVGSRSLEVGVSMLRLCHWGRQDNCRWEEGVLWAIGCGVGACGVTGSDIGGAGTEEGPLFCIVQNGISK